MINRLDRLLTVVAAGLGTIAGVAACGAGGGTAVDGAPRSTLTIGINAGPASLDPAMAANTAEGLIYSDLAYAPLITLNGDGSLAPALATSWRYTDKTLTTFELTLRSGAKFSDGSPVTADAVSTSLQRTKKANGAVSATYAALIKSAVAEGPRTVVLHLMQRNPTIALVLTQRFLVGGIVGPKGLAAPRSLTTSTDGAGQYVLDATDTVANDHYSYVPNPGYWNPSAVHFKKVVVRVIPNPQTAFNAVKSGQVQFVDGAPSTVSEAAGDSAFTVHSVPAAWYGIDLIGRTGALVPALTSQKVRQALNYAVNREAITSALFGKYGQPTSEITDSAYADDGYDASYVNHYEYDPTLAKNLLAQAGYPNGFSMTIAAVASYGDGVELAQAIASDWAKIGVRASIKTFPSESAFGNEILDKKVPAFTMSYDAQPIFLESTQLLNEDAGFFNMFQSADPQLTSLLAAARAQTQPAAIAKAWAAVQRRVVDLGWFVPVSIGPEQFYADKKLQGVTISARFSSPDPTQLHY